jgi:hypothetical protein
MTTYQPTEECQTAKSLLPPEWICRNSTFGHNNQRTIHIAFRKSHQAVPNQKLGESSSKEKSPILERMGLDNMPAIT